MSKNNNTQKIVGLGLFTAIVIVLQLMGSFIRFGTFSISLVLVPVVIGAALYGAGAGAWLGFVFGVVVLLSGDAAAFLGVNALGTILTVLVKGTLAGLLSGLVYKALENKNRTLAVAVAAVVCPVVNTGVFLIGCLLFFMETIGGWADAMGFGANVGQYMIVGLVGANFIFELLFNVVLSPVERCDRENSQRRRKSDRDNHHIKSDYRESGGSSRDTGRRICRKDDGRRCRCDPDRGRNRGARSEERRVGKECRSRWSPYH